LQAVWAIIPELSGFKQFVQIAHQLFAFHRYGLSCTGCG